MTEDTGLQHVEAKKPLLKRRAVLATGGFGVLAAGAAVAIPSVAGAVKSQTMVTADSRTNAGAGMYASPNTVLQMSGFTINTHGVTCAVGTLAVHLSDIADMLPVGLPLPPLSHSGPFAMHMAGLSLASYTVDSAAGTIVARGRMRSVTKAGGVTLEDVEHDFHAIAIAGRGKKPDFFATSFSTPFWNTGNPMATKSKFVEGLVMFGGNLIMGEVSVA